MPGKKPSLPAEVPWSPMDGFLFVILFFLLSGFALILGGWEADALPDAGVALLFPHGGVLLAIVLFLYLRSGSFSRMKHFGALHTISLPSLVKKAILPVMIAGATLYAWLLLHAMLQARLGYTVEEQYLVQLIREHVRTLGRYELAGIFFVVTVFVPIAEEFLYRIVLYFPIRQRIGKVKAVVLISFIFAALHVEPPVETGTSFIMGAVLAIGQIFILSALFFVLLEKTRSVLAPIIAHCAYNGLVVVLLLGEVARGAAETA